MMWSIFSYAYLPSIYYLVKGRLRFLAHFLFGWLVFFLGGLFVFLLLSFKSSLYQLWLLQIFSPQFVACFSILLALQVWTKVQDFVFPTSFEVMLMLLVQGPHLGNN